jgi:hypothetical protein
MLNFGEAGDQPVSRWPIRKTKEKIPGSRLLGEVLFFFM